MGVVQMALPAPVLAERILSALIAGPMSESAIAARVDDTLHPEILRTFLHRLRIAGVVIREALLWRLTVMPPKAPVIGAIVCVRSSSVPALDPSQKWCSSCQRIKPRTEFYRRFRSTDGLQSHCKCCQIEQMRVSGNPITVREKRCSTCHTVKAAGDFYRNRRSADGLRAECRHCKDAHVRSTHWQRIVGKGASEPLSTRKRRQQQFSIAMKIKWAEKDG